MENQAPLLPNEIKSYLEKEGNFNLKCFHLNAQSAVNKGNDLELLFDQSNVNFDIIMITETWYNDDSDIFRLPSHDTYFSNRILKRGGGLSILTKKGIDCDVLSDYSFITKDVEVLCLRNGQIVFAVFYRPPDGNLLAFFEAFETFLVFINDNQYNVICGGDFNIDMYSDSTSKREMNNLVSMYGCANTIVHPTRITLRSETTLDLFITNFHTDRLSSGVISCDLSDHLPIFLCVKLNVSRKSIKHRPAVFQNINKNSLDAFRQDIAAAAWDNVLMQTTVDDAYNTFLEQFLRLYERHFPYKSVVVSNKSRKPWVTSCLLRKIRKKDALYKRFIKTRDPDVLKEFKSFRNNLTKELRNAKKSFYSSLFSSANGRTDIMWKHLGSLVKGAPASNNIETLQHRGVKLTNRELANVFNEYFVDIGVSAGVNADVANACKHVCRHNCSSIFLKPTDSSEILNVITHVKNSGSCDADGLQIRPVKYVVDLIASVLSYIFNLSLETCVFPKRMQIAKVTVLYKKGDKNELGNYRPISILPVFSKALEKILYQRLVDFSNKWDLVTSSQFGFRKNCSTETALINQKEYILENFENKKFVLGVFLDFTKAFDCLSHGVLLKKLEAYGIRGQALLLLQSYLEYRQQYVNLNGYSSTARFITSGVPQGSILGPFLFNLYINDIVNVNKHAKFVIYADDTSVFFSSDTCDDLIDMANLTLSKIKSWEDSNSLKINIHKTKAVIFRPKNKPVVLSKVLTFSSTPIEIVSCFKTLGVIFSEGMSWDSHINYLIPKLARVVGIINRYRSVLPTNVKLLLYKSLFFSHLTYCHLVWGTSTFTNIEKLFMLQKKILRCICNVSRDFHTADLFKNFQIITIHKLYQYRLSTSYKSEKTRGTCLLENLASLRKTSPPYPTRNPEKWRMVTQRTNYGSQMINFTLPHLLNSLSSNNIDLESLTFRELRLLYACS